MTLCQAVTPHRMKLNKNKVLLSEQNTVILDKWFTLESINRLELGFDVQQFVFHRESLPPATLSLWLEPHVGAYAFLTCIVSQM